MICINEVIEEHEVQSLLDLEPHLSWRKGRSGDYFRSSKVVVPEELLGRLRRHFGISDKLFWKAELLQMPEGSALKPHVDQFPLGIMQVLVMLRPALCGGILHLEGHGAAPTAYRAAIAFNANKTKHWVTEVVAGDRRVLSIWFSQGPHPD